MKLKALVLALAAVPFVASAGATINEANGFDVPGNNYYDGAVHIEPGYGYSSDMHQTAPFACYQQTATENPHDESIVRLSQAMSYSDFLSTVHASFNASGGYGLFSANADADYFRSLQDRSYSLSLNYAYVLYRNNNLQLGGYGEKALTPWGQSAYDSGDNPLFGVTCGNNVYTSYALGASLLMSIEIKFASSEEKQTFTAHAGASFGDIANASAEINKEVNQYHLHGSVTIQAYQSGGTPSNLNKILSKNSEGTYYALTCHLDKMDDCIQAANGILAYAQNEFPKQISYSQNKGLSSLGIGFASYQPISKIGLKNPQSIVTTAIKQDRETLASELLESDYYKDHLGRLVDDYPVVWNVSSSAYKDANYYYKQATKNVMTLLSPQNPQEGGAGCYDEPGECPEIFDNIQEKVVPISYSKDLGFLSGVKNIFDMTGGLNSQGLGTTTYGVIYPINGSGDEWGYVNSYPDPVNPFTITQIVIQPKVTPTSFTGKFAMWQANWRKTRYPDYTLKSTDGGKSYTGTVVGWWNNGTTVPGQISPMINPYYFTAYQPIGQTQEK